MVTYIDYLVFRGRKYKFHKNFKYYNEIYGGEQDAYFYSIYQFLYEVEVRKLY